MALSSAKKNKVKLKKKQRSQAKAKATSSDDVKQAQAEVTKRRLARGQSDQQPASPLQAIKMTPAEALTEQQWREAIAEVDKAIAGGKLLPPKDAGILTRLLYALKQALFDLANIQPRVYYEELAQAKARLREMQANNPAEQASANEQGPITGADDGGPTIDSAVATGDGSPLLNPAAEKLAAVRVAIDAVLRESL